MKGTQRLRFGRLAAAIFIGVMGVMALDGCASSPEPGASAGAPCNAGDRWVTDPPWLHMETHYADGVVTFAVCGQEGQEWDVELTTTGGIATDMTALSLTLGEWGLASFEVPITVDSSRRGSITARFSNDYPEMGDGKSLWFEPTKDGGFAQGSSQIDAQLRAIDQDYPTEEERQRAFEELGRVDADEVTVESG